jgi:hypothetical protein
MVFASYSWNNGGLKKKRKEKNGRDAAVLRAATTIHPPFKVCRMSQSISGSCNTTLSLSLGAAAAEERDGQEGL